MNKTKVDDMLIEMISPKVKEIEEKFARGEGLSQDDINTLLLKSQYNHINHLDIKLDETVESVKELRNDFNALEQRVESKINTLQKDFNALEQRVESKINALQKDFNALEERLNAQINGLKKDFKSLEQKVSSDIKSLEEKIEASIQKALNKNMMLLIVVIGFFMTLSKLIDKF
ncbi:MAG: hypothetical protein DSY40_03135 [Nautilia sp.]|nr:MAG: hypothetical protein DSY40_03135 [Nautilia sp.]